MNIVALDFETADYGRDSACALGLVRLADGAVQDSLYFLIKPPRETFRFSYLHGITWQHVRDEATFADRWAEIAEFIAGAEFLAAHNAGFDRSVMLSCCADADIAPPAQPFICTVRLARGVWDIRPTKLSDVCAYHDIELDHHHALSDANACAEIVAAGLHTGADVADFALAPKRC
jgi:DNA polymerase-3 subunit epsilon